MLGCTTRMYKDILPYPTRYHPRPETSQSSGSSTSTGPCAVVIKQSLVSAMAPHSLPEQSPYTINPLRAGLSGYQGAIWGANRHLLGEVRFLPVDHTPSTFFFWCTTLVPITSSMAMLYAFAESECNMTLAPRSQSSAIGRQSESLIGPGPGARSLVTRSGSGRITNVSGMPLAMMPTKLAQTILPGECAYFASVTSSTSTSDHGGRVLNEIRLCAASVVWLWLFLRHWVRSVCLLGSGVLEQWPSCLSLDGVHSL